MKKLYIKEIGTDKVVREIEVKPTRERQINKAIRGILRQMNRDKYYLDDSEFD